MIHISPYLCLSSTITRKIFINDLNKYGYEVYLRNDADLSVATGDEYLSWQTWEEGEAVAYCLYKYDIDLINDTRWHWLTDPNNDDEEQG